MFFYLAWVICILDSTRYMDSLLISRAKKQMRSELRGLKHQQFHKSVPVQREIERRFPTYTGVRSFLLKKRVRLHLFSGIEYQMFIFIIAPLTGFIKEMVVVSSLVMIVFELLVIYKLYLSTIDFSRELHG